MHALLNPVNILALVVVWAAMAAVLLMAAGVVAYLRRRDPVTRRLGELSSGSEHDPSLLPWLRQVGVAFLERLSAPARPRKPWESSKLRRELMLAGFSSPVALNLFLGIKVCCAALLPLALLAVPLPQQLGGALLVFVYSMAAGVGFLLPSLVLETLGRRRRERISRELPEVLDLLVIAVEAGLGLDAAVQRVAREVTMTCPILASELKMVSLELKAGVPRERAFKNLADRCGVDDVSSLVAMLNQADRFGVSVGRSLRVHSDTVRTKWRQRMEERAAKVPLKLLFPVLFMIFPAVLVVMAGPAIIQVSETMFK